MEKLRTTFQEVLGSYREDVLEHVRAVADNGGVMSSRRVEFAVEALDMGLSELMVSLLPLGAAYSVTPSSDFGVGAVAAGLPASNGFPSLYLGANFEIAGASLSTAVHAEQTATMHAWLQGEEGLSRLATSTTPCGYCRQFLAELTGADELEVFIQVAAGHTTTTLSNLLPARFGPDDLGVEAGLMDPRNAGHSMTLAHESDDELVLEALAAANGSYAPYTRNYAGCAVLMPDGTILSGRYAENAAFNPSLSPLQTVAALMNVQLDSTTPRRIERVCLVESSGSGISQRATTEYLLGALQSDVKVEYRVADNESA